MFYTSTKNTSFFKNCFHDVLNLPENLFKTDTNHVVVVETKWLYE